VAKKKIPIMPVFTQCQIITEQDEKMGFASAMRDRVKRQLDANYAAIRKARSRGIEILSGTDSGNAAAFSHGAYHGREPELLMKEIGLSAMEAIHACTRLNAKTIGLDGKVGVIAPGMLADIIAWKRDPLADIRVLQQPEHLSMILKDGRLVERGCEGFRALRTEPPRANITAQG
jgi:imidazolonepropionase-like amidohydrolase